MDLIIIGAGLAGCVAALTAAEAGAKVALLEKRSIPGGSSVLSADCYAFAGTEVQHRAGIIDSPALLQEDLLAVGGGESCPDLVAAYAEAQLGMFDWLQSRGAIFHPTLDTGAGQSVPRVHTTNTGGLIASLLRQCERSGHVSLALSTRALRLHRDATGRVNGVTFQGPTGARGVEYAAGILLTTGGFIQDHTLVHRYAPQYDGALRVSGAGASGDGLRMACDIGADVRDMAYIKGTFGVRADSSGEHLNCMAVYKGAIAVNQAGERFIDESKSYKVLGDACIAQPGQIAYQILDQDILESGEGAVRILDLMRHYAQGLFITADSLGALAARLGIPEAALQATVERYNDDVLAGPDTRYGREHLVHRYGKLRPILRPPFHAYPSAVALFGTYCGVAVDAAMRVRNVFQEPIAGLYAAGEVVGGFHGAAYMTGTALGKAAIFGKLAADSALSGRSG